MSSLLQAGYFSIKNPLDIFDRWLNPFQKMDNIDIRGKNMAVHLSKRAKKALEKRKQPLIAELQLYFTCVVQKRVNFHESTELETLSTNQNLEIIYHTVQSDACNPIEFAEKHPVKKELNSKGAKAMRPSSFMLDYKNKQWLGSFKI